MSRVGFPSSSLPSPTAKNNNNNKQLKQANQERERKQEEEEKEKRNGERTSKKTTKRERERERVTTRERDTNPKSDHGSRCCLAESTLASTDGNDDTDPQQREAFLHGATTKYSAAKVLHHEHLPDAI
jgi:hypothetical protein